MREGTLRSGPTDSRLLTFFLPGLIPSAPPSPPPPNVVPEELVPLTRGTIEVAFFVHNIF